MCPLTSPVVQMSFVSSGWMIHMHWEYSQAIDKVQHCKIGWCGRIMVTSVTPRTAWLSAKAPFHQFKTRLLKDGTEQSKSVANKLAGTHIFIAHTHTPHTHTHTCTHAHTCIHYPSFHLYPEELRPCGSAPRPKTTALVARRLVVRTLGVQLSREQREREKVQRMELQMARGKSERREGVEGTHLTTNGVFFTAQKRTEV